MIKTNIYKHPNTTSIYKIVTAVCFLLFLIAKPILQSTIYINNIEFEVFNISEKENSKSETETEIDFENETTDFLFKETSFQRYDRLVFLYYKQSNSFLNYHLDIHLPPPKV